MIAGDDPTLPHGGNTRGPELERVGRFLVLDRLGEGAMGVVYSAYDPELDRRVAIKVLRDASADTEARSRMQREARAMARLADPHVVAVHDVGVHDGQVFIAMELIKGGTLRDWLRRTPRTWREVVAAFVDAGKGLAAAHDAGIVHRDFKPENVLVDARGRVRVTDFGLARGGEVVPARAETPLLDRHPTGIDDLVLTEKGAVVGTPAYMSPEQIMGRATDARSDQFSYCIALWEALHGERPFDGDNLVDLAANVAAGKRRSSSAVKHDGARGHQEATGSASHPASVPAWLRARIDRGLSTDPSARYPSMLALIGDLQRDPTRQRRRIFVASVAALIVLLGAGAWQAWRQSQDAACDARGNEIFELWPGVDSVRRVAIQEAFAMTGKAFAEPTFSTTAGMLDAWAEQWRESAAAVCQADRDGFRDDRTRDLAQACLRERSEAISGLLDALSEADVATVVGAAGAAAQLPPPIVCRDELALLGSPRPPAGTDDEDVSHVRRALAKAGALRVGGRADLARVEVSGIVDDADAIGWPPLQAAARLELALAMEELDDLQEAEVTLRQSLEDALRGADDAVAVLASARLASVQAALARPKEGHASMQLGHALLDRVRARRAAELAVDASTVELEVAVLGADASLAFEENRFEDAAGLSRQIHDRLRQAHGETSPESARELVFAGWIHHLRGDVGEAVPLVVEGMQLQQDALGSDHPVVATTMGKLGEIYRNVPDKQEEGRALMERSLRILTDTYGERHAEVADAVARLAHVQPTAMEARRMFERELEILEAIRGPTHPALGGALHNLADIDRGEGMFVEAEAKYRRVLTLWDNATVPRKAASAHKFLASALIGQDRLEEAERELVIALELEDLALADSPIQATTWEGLAFVRRKRNDLTGALEAMRRALAILDRGSPPEALRVRMEARTADILLELGDEEEGLKLAEHAFAAARVEDRASLAFAQFILARARWKSSSGREAALGLAVQAKTNFQTVGDKVGAGLVHEWMLSLARGDAEAEHGEPPR